MLVVSGCNVINILTLRNANDDVEPIWHSSQSQFPIAKISGSESN